MLNKAVRADENQDYLPAQRYYLQAIEYLIPAIQYEKDHSKKNEIREKAKIYLRRAEELANLIRPRSSSTTKDDVSKKEDDTDHKKNSQSLTHFSSQVSSEFVSIPIEFENKLNISNASSTVNKTQIGASGHRCQSKGVVNTTPPSLTFVSSLHENSTNNQTSFNLCKK